MVQTVHRLRHGGSLAPICSDAHPQPPQFPPRRAAPAAPVRRSPLAVGRSRPAPLPLSGPCALCRPALSQGLPIRVGLLFVHRVATIFLCEQRLHVPSAPRLPVLASAPRCTSARTCQRPRLLGALFVTPLPLRPQRERETRSAQRDFATCNTLVAAWGDSPQPAFQRFPQSHPDPLA